MAGCVQEVLQVAFGGLEDRKIDEPCSQMVVQG